MAVRRISGWFYLASILAAIVMFAILLVGLRLIKPAAATTEQPTAVMTVILAPTSTPLLPADLYATQTPTPHAEAVIDGIGKGLYVQIFGTGGDGLRLRAEASTTAEVRFLGYESEVFLVNEGPKNSDGYIWWYLTAPYDESRSGWAVADYLEPIVEQP